MDDLSKSVAANAEILAAEIRDKSLPPLDDEAFPVSFPLLSPEGSRARFELISAALNIVRLASGPSEFLGNLSLQVKQQDRDPEWALTHMALAGV